MAVEFRCDKCGKLLNVEAEPSSRIKCPYCKSKVQVPAAVASLPRPQVPGGVMPPPPPPAAQGQAQGEEEPLVEQPSELMGAMATAMPWVISVFLHAGVLLILAFITIVMLKTNPQGDIVVPDADLSDNPGGVLNPGEMNPELQAKSLEKINQQQWAKRDAAVPSLGAVGETTARIQVIGIAGGAAGGGPTADFGMSTGGSGAGPKSNFLGSGGNAYHIVYVVDSSGSMMESFDLVRKELLRSISRLSPAQTFHVIFFNNGPPRENPQRQLVFADENAKRGAAAYLKTVQPQGGSPTIPNLAIQRAFEVLARTPNQKRGKLMYLLTDGEFHDNEEVRALFAKLNTDKSVHVNTLIYMFQNPEFEKVMRKIAEENGGKYKFVERNG